MTIINLRTADGFTLHDNYFSVPDEWTPPMIRQAVSFCQINPLVEETGWDGLYPELARAGIEPVPNATHVPAMTIDIEF